MAQAKKRYESTNDKQQAAEQQNRATSGKQQAATKYKIFYTWNSC